MYDIMIYIQMKLAALTQDKRRFIKSRMMYKNH